MERAKNESTFRRSVTRFSYVPYQGLKSGTILKANPEKSFSGIFKNCEILLYHVGIEDDTHGLILNKEYYFDDNWNLFGGPCDPDNVFILHNISAVPGAKQIQKGLFLGGSLIQYLLIMWDVFQKLKQKTNCQINWGYSNNHPSNFKNDLDTSQTMTCLLYTSPSPRDLSTSRMPSSA